MALMLRTFTSFVRSVCEYGGIIFMGASAAHLHKLVSIQRWLRNCMEQHFYP